MSNAVERRAAREGGRRATVLFAGIIALHAAVAVTFAVQLNLWEDEAYSLITTTGTPSHVLHQALHFEMQPPLYFLALYVWRHLGDSILVARLFSLSCTLATLLVVVGLSKRLLPAIHPGWVLAVTALNPFLLWAAVEARVYAAAVLLSSLLLLFFFDGYLAEKSTSKARWGYGITALVALYTQYYLGFFLLANGAALLLFRRWRALRTNLIAMFAVGVCFLPMLMILPSQFSAHTETVAETVSWAESFLRIGVRMWRYVLVTNYDGWSSPWSRGLANGILLAGVCVAALAMIRRRSRLPDAVTLQLWAITALLAIGLVPVAQLTGWECLQLRHTAAMFILCVLSTLALAQAIGSRRGVLALVCVMLCYNGTAIGVVAQRMAKFGDWRRLTSYIMDEELRDQPIAVFLAPKALPFAYYYRGPNTIVPIPEAEECKTLDLTRWVVESQEEIEDRLRATPGGGRRLWFVLSGLGSYLGVDFRRDVVRAFVEENYIVERRARFYCAEVKLLRRKPADAAGERPGEAENAGR